MRGNEALQHVAVKLVKAAQIANSTFKRTDYARLAHIQSTGTDGFLVVFLAFIFWVPLCLSHLNAIPSSDKKFLAADKITVSSKHHQKNPHSYSRSHDRWYVDFF